MTVRVARILGRAVFTEIPTLGAGRIPLARDHTVATTIAWAEKGRAALILAAALVGSTPRLALDIRPRRARVRLARSGGGVFARLLSLLVVRGPTVCGRSPRDIMH